MVGRNSTVLENNLVIVHEPSTNSVVAVCDVETWCVARNNGTRRALLHTYGVIGTGLYDIPRRVVPVTDELPATIEYPLITIEHGLGVDIDLGNVVR